MILFWVTAFLMTLIALAILIIPMLRGVREAGPGRKEANVAIYRKQIDALQAELDDGLITANDFAASKQELDRNLLADTVAVETVSERGSGRVPALITAITIPVIAVSLYLGLGSVELIDRPATKTTPDVSAQMQSIEKMVSGLAERLKQNPNDSEGWVMLGRSYTALRRFGDAEQAYAKAYTLIGDDPDFLADYAEILAMNANNQLKGPPMRLLQTALKKNPRHIKSLWLAGHGELQTGNSKKAVAYWKKLITVLPKGDEAVATVRQYIAQVEGQQPAQAPRATAQTASLTVQVSLQPALAKKLKPEQVVYVFARAAQGPRIPLAIVRKQVRDLPLTVTLDDSMAMTPQMKLSGFEQVVVGARVSMSGNAIAQSGDVQGLSGAVNSASKQPVSVVIDSVVP